MKKILINYYAIEMLALFMGYNMLLESLKIGGIIYQILMLIVIIVNIFILVKYRNDLKGKSFAIVIYFLFTFLISKSILQFILGISSMITLIIIGFKKSNFIKVIAFLIMIFLIKFFVPLILALLLVFDFDLNENRGINDIYEDMHYSCDNNIHVYSYSAGAMDSFHYSKGKHYDLLDINDIIYIIYRERNELTKEEYERYIETHNCSLVGDEDESK